MRSLDEAGKYGVRYSTYAVTLVEGKLNMPIHEVGAKLSNSELGISALVTLAWAGLEGFRRKNTPRKPSIKWEDVGDIIDECGGVRKVTPTILDSFMEAFPKPDTENQTVEGDNPLQETQDS